MTSLAVLVCCSLPVWRTPSIHAGCLVEQRYRSSSNAVNTARAAVVRVMCRIFA